MSNDIAKKSRLIILDNNQFPISLPGSIKAVFKIGVTEHFGVMLVPLRNVFTKTVITVNFMFLLTVIYILHMCRRQNQSSI